MKFLHKKVHTPYIYATLIDCSRCLLVYDNTNKEVKIIKEKKKGKRKHG